MPDSSTRAHRKPEHKPHNCEEFGDVARRSRGLRRTARLADAFLRLGRAPSVRAWPLAQAHQRQSGLLAFRVTFGDRLVYMGPHVALAFRRAGCCVDSARLAPHPAACGLPAHLRGRGWPHLATDTPRARLVHLLVV